MVFNIKQKVIAFPLAVLCANAMEFGPLIDSNHGLGVGLHDSEHKFTVSAFIKYESEKNSGYAVSFNDSSGGFGALLLTDPSTNTLSLFGKATVEMPTSIDGVYMHFGAGVGYQTETSSAKDIDYPAPANFEVTYSKYESASGNTTTNFTSPYTQSYTASNLTPSSLKYNTASTKTQGKLGIHALWGIDFHATENLTIYATQSLLSYESVSRNITSANSEKDVSENNPDAIFIAVTTASTGSAESYAKPTSDIPATNTVTWGNLENSYFSQGQVGDVADTRKTTPFKIGAVSSIGFAYYINV